MFRTVLLLTLPLLLNPVNLLAQEPKPTKYHELTLPEESWVSVVLQQDISPDPNSPYFVNLGGTIKGHLSTAIVINGHVVAHDGSEVVLRVIETRNALVNGEKSKLVLDIIGLTDTSGSILYRLTNVPPLTIKRTKKYDWSGSIEVGHQETLWFQVSYHKHPFPQDHIGFIQPMVMQRNYGWSILNLNLALKDYGEVMFLSFGVGAGVRKAGPQDHPISRGTFIGTFYPVSIRVAKSGEGSAYFNLGVVREFATKDWGFIGGISFHAKRS